MTWLLFHFIKDGVAVFGGVKVGDGVDVAGSWVAVTTTATSFVMTNGVWVGFGADIGAGEQAETMRMKSIAEVIWFFIFMLSQLNYKNRFL